MNRISAANAVVGIAILLSSLISASAEDKKRTGQTTPATTVDILYNFQGGSDGTRPLAPLIVDSFGNLYGATQFGGISKSSGGTVFKLTRNGSAGWTESVLHTFQGKPDGEQPVSAVTMDAHGNLYGTTPTGGLYGHGTVYQLLLNTRGTYQFKTLYYFSGGSDGGGGYNAVIIDKAGNLYGATNFGGAYSYGTVFRLARQSAGTYVFSVIYNFGAPGDGVSPTGLVFDSFGNIFGTTAQGGAYSNGVVFELARGAGGTWTENILYSFTGTTDGGYPEAGPIFDKHGALYGTTNLGGNSTTCGYATYGCGTVYQLKRSAGSNWTFTKLHLFDGGNDGQYPISPIAFDSFGNLYGTTAGGGNLQCFGGCGTVFQMSRSAGSWTYSQVYAFQGGTNDGASPYGLTVDGANSIYGATNSGGAEGYGVVYEIPSSTPPE